jgi:peptide deformylase
MVKSMILPIRLYTDKILKQPCDLITDFTGLDKLAGDMIETMLAYKGIGLAANQVGVNKNLAALYLEDKTKIIMVANIIIKGYTKETDVQNEGCLSCPGVSIPIKRHLGIDIEAQRLNGEKINLRFEGFDARILQHEYWHLQGSTIADEIMKL